MLKGRLLEIIEGRAEMSLAKVNAYRAKHGLPAIREEDRPEGRSPSMICVAVEAPEPPPRQFRQPQPRPQRPKARIVARKPNRRSKSKPSPPLKPIPFTGPVRRNLIYHVYPVRGNGVWQWNVAELLKRISLFNGKRVVAVATDEATDGLDEVKAAFANHAVEFIHVRNERRIGFRPERGHVLRAR